MHGGPPSPALQHRRVCWASSAHLESEEVRLQEVLLWDRWLVTGRASVSCLKTHSDAPLRAAVSPAFGPQRGLPAHCNCVCCEIIPRVKAGTCLCFPFSAPPALAAKKRDKDVTKSSARNGSLCLLQARCFGPRAPRAFPLQPFSSLNKASKDLEAVTHLSSADIPKSLSGSQGTV